MIKYTKWIGLAAAIALGISCFLPWTFHADLNKYFTGFFSESNSYGKPGKLLLTVAILAIPCFLISKVWVKRTMLMISAIAFAYALKSFLIYGACYRGYCPEKQPGLWLMLISSGLVLLMAVFPDMKIPEKKDAEKAMREAEKKAAGE